MKVNKNYVLKHLLDADLLININDEISGVIKLNKTSKDIYSYINDGLNKEEVIEKLSNEYDIDLETLKKDVDEFINEMIQRGIFINE